MKKLKLLLPVSLLLLTAVLLSSCGHVHDIVIDPEVAPTCAATGKTEGAHCSSCGEVIVKQKEIPMVAHNIEKTGCTTCDLKASEGLAYEVRGEYAYVTIGTCTDEEVIISPYDSNGNKVLWIDFSETNATKVKKITVLGGIESFSADIIAPSVESIELPSNLVRIGSLGMFRGCDNLKSIDIPEGCITIARSTFYGCKGLETITLNDYIHIIEVNAFKDCVNLKEITIPKYVSRIEEGTFSGCSSLEKITLPMDISYIGDYAFAQCESLTEIEVPIGVMYLGEGVFEGCYDLEKIYSPHSVDTFIASHTIKKHENWHKGLLGSVKIVCTDGEITISEYKQMINQTPED